MSGGRIAATLQDFSIDVGQRARTTVQANLQPRLAETSKFTPCVPETFLKFGGPPFG